jgi:hypothetical protein
MSMQTYYELKDILCRELDEVTRKGELSPGSLDIVDKLTHSIKSLETIIAMNEAQEGRSFDDSTSGYHPYMYGGRSYEGRSYDSNMMRSGRRGRDSMGRYASRDEERDKMVMELEDLMRTAKDEHTRMKFQRFIDDMRNM